MLTYILRKIILTLITLLLLSLLAFLLMHWAPGDALYKQMGQQLLSPAEYHSLYNSYQLNRPAVLQYFHYVGNIISGDFGISTATGRTVATELARTLPATFELVAYALAMAIVVGIPTGTLAAFNQDSFLDRTILGSSLIGTSIPTFLWALLLIMLFSLSLGWLPLSGRLSLLYEVPPITHILLVDIYLSDLPYKMAVLRDALAHLFMPVIAVAAIPTTQVIRTTRNSMVRTMRSPFIKAARARGLGRWRVLMRHALPNVLLPVSRDLSLQFGTLFTGTMIVENIFSWPGIGHYLVTSVRQQDLPALQSCVLVVGGLILLLSILSDILHSHADPLSRLESHDVD